jgi:hypothetical protein
MGDGSFVAATNEEIGKVFQRSDLGPWLISCYNFGYSVALPVVSFEVPCQNLLDLICLSMLIYAQHMDISPSSSLLS